MREELNLLHLPNELILPIFRHLPRKDLFFGVAHVNHRFRSIVHKNLKTLRLFDAHCHVNIVDNRPLNTYRDDGTDPIITYTFTLFDTRGPEFTQKRRLCLRGNDVKFRELHVSHVSNSMMQAQFEMARSDRDITIPPSSAQILLSYMNIQAVRFQVRKQCKPESRRVEDDFFLDCIQFLERQCTKVDIKSLLLCSKNILFVWQLGQKSLLKMSKMQGLQNLILENMTTFDPFAKGFKLPVRNLSSLQFRLDPRHQMDTEQFTVQHINGGLLKLLLAASVYRLDFSAYTEVSKVVSRIDVLDMCLFIEEWHYMPKPWIIRNISFNSTVSIDDFRAAAFNLLPPNFIEAVPYCRFQTIHRKSKSLRLELACYANGNATQWIIRTGYIDV